MEEKKVNMDDINVKVIRKCANCGQILSDNAYDCWKCSSTDIVEVAEEETQELEEKTLQAQFDELKNEFKKYKTVSYVMIGLFAILLLLYIIK